MSTETSTRTPVCELLGIDHPIVEAPVAADPRLPAAVSNAGGLGTLGLGWADDAGEVVRATAALTDRPFAGNFVLAFDQHHRIDQALSAGLRVASLFWGDPQDYVELVHDAGGLVMHTVGSVDEARRAVGCGVDIVVAQGWEAGGHVWSGVATLPLVPAVVDAVAPDSYRFKDWAKQGHQTFHDLSDLIDSRYTLVDEANGVLLYERVDAVNKSG